MNRLSHNQSMILLTAFTVLISILPIMFIAPTWLNLACLFCIFFRSFQTIFNSRPTHWTIKLILTISGFILLVLEFKGRLDYIFFIYFLVLFVSFKVLEIQTKRDYLSQVLVNLYVLFASLIVVMELWIFAYIIIASILNFIVLYKLNNPTIRLSILHHSNLPLLGVALILTIFLFYVFPRISSPLWQIPSPGQKQTGFSDKLQLGDVHELALNDNQAMKVVSHVDIGRFPYWRGLALTFYDGVSWQLSKAAGTSFANIPSLPSYQKADIEIILEPTNTPWLITKDQVDKAYPSLIYIPNVGITLLTKQRITRQIGYRFNLSTKPSRMMSPGIWHLNRQYPSYANPRLQTWTKKLMRESQQKPSVFIDSLKKEIQSKPFWYTLNPAPIGRNAGQLDRFWFETREGYCEYYASTIAFILRVAGIPARVIVGYQGGHWNPIGEYLVIKQSDAHAWVEYWNDKEGWLRLDPTSWIPNNRIDNSIQSRVQRLRQTGFGFDRYGRNLSFLQRARYYLESVQFFWQRWLLFYNYDTQQQLLDIISSRSIFVWLYKNAIWLWIVISMFATTISLYFWRHRPSPLQRQITRMHQMCDKLDIQYKPPETFSTFCKQLTDRFPNESLSIRALQQEYETMRYKCSRPTPYHNLVKFLKKVIKKSRKMSKRHTRIN